MSFFLTQVKALQNDQDRLKIKVLGRAKRVEIN
jgi:hypothetical protein